MADFTYTGRNQGGALVSGQVQAASLNAAAADLSGDGITPIEIFELRTAARAPKRKTASFNVATLNDMLAGNKIDITDLIIFSRQMFSLTKAGMPLDRALRGLGASISNPAMKRLLSDVARQLEQGHELTVAFSRHPRVFSALYLALISVGESTGRLDLAFAQVGKYLELERSTSKQIKSATRYPLFVLIAIIMALAVITVFVIPVFAETFDKLQADLPWQTIALISVSDFMVEYWYLLLAAVAATTLLFRRWTSTGTGRSRWDQNKLGIPLVGGVFERVALSRFARTFAMMSKAGVPVVQALAVIARAVGNKYIGDNVLKMQEAISHGESLYKAALKSNMFSPLVLQMIAVGEESGSVDDLMAEVADFYDAEVEYDLKRLGSTVEPILIVCIAGIVLVLALGVFLPIWDLTSAAG